MYYVTMTDKFMSGWGMAKDKINIMIVECDTLEQAEQIESAAHDRSEMFNINIHTDRPEFDSDVVESFKTWNDLGAIWKGELA